MTSIIADQPGPAELSKATARTIANIQARIDGMGDLIQFLRTNQDLPGNPNTYDHAILVSLSAHPDPKAAISAWMLRAIGAGAAVTPMTGEKHAGVNLHFGGAAPLQVYAESHMVGARVEVSRTEYRLDVEIPEHAHREQPAGGA